MGLTISMVTKRLSCVKGWGVDISPYLHTRTPIKFLDYEIYVKRQETNFATKVLFRNVPLNVPDEELLNLALCYGQPAGRQVEGD